MLINSDEFNEDLSSPIRVKLAKYASDIYLSYTTIYTFLSRDYNNKFQEIAFKFDTADLKRRVIEVLHTINFEDFQFCLLTKISAVLKEKQYSSTNPINDINVLRDYLDESKHKRKDLPAIKSQIINEINNLVEKVAGRSIVNAPCNILSPDIIRSLTFLLEPEPLLLSTPSLAATYHFETISTTGAQYSLPLAENQEEWKEYSSLCKRLMGYLFTC